MGSRDNTMCLVGAGKGVPLSVEKCTPHFGAFSQVRNDDGTVTLQSQGLCLTGLRDGSADFDAGDSFGMFTCDPAYADFQNFQLSGSYKTDLMLPASNLCVSAEGYDVVAAPCDDFSTEQNFRLVQSSANIPAPAPRPSPKPSKKRMANLARRIPSARAATATRATGSTTTRARSRLITRRRRSPRRSPRLLAARPVTRTRTSAAVVVALAVTSTTRSLRTPTRTLAASLCGRIRHVTTSTRFHYKPLPQKH